MSLQAVFEELVELPPEQRGERLRALSLTDHERQRLESMLEHATDRTKLLDLPIGNLIEHLRADDVMFARLAGGMVGPFRVLDLIGEGGSAAVFRASRPAGSGEQLVALKVLRASRFSADAERRFRREQAILAQLTHPNVARLIEGGVDSSGYPYIAMELVEGEPITRAAAARRLGVKERLEWMLCLCRAIEAAHLALIVHCDLKPSNILVDREGVIKVLDFGVARLIDASREDQPTRTIALTPEYAAPELATDNLASVRSDIYALGGVLYFLLSGRSPLVLEGLALAPLVDAIRTREPARIDADADATLAAEPRHRVADLEAIARKALAKDPARRYGSVETMLRDVDAALADRPIAARDIDARDRARRFVRRHRVALAAGTVLLLALLAGLAGTLWQAREARVQRDRAEREAARAIAEAGTATAVRDFLVGVFAAANPEETGGNTPTALDLADAALRRVDGELHDQPRLQAPLLAALGAAYDGLGQVDRSFATLRRAREIAVSTEGADSLDALRLTVALAAAVAAHPNGDTPQRREEIAPLLSAIVEREMPGADASLRVAALTQYGVLLQAGGDSVAAEANFQRAIDIGRAAGDAAAAPTADALLALHDLLTQQGRVGDAIARLREALAIRILRDGPQAAATVAVQASLGFLLGEAGSLDEADGLLGQVLDARRTIYGARHPRYAHALIALASIRERQGRADDAETMLREALAVAQSALGADSDLALSALNSLSGVRTAQRDLEGAIARSREAVAMAARMYGDEHELTLRLRDNLIGSEAMNGAYAEAEADARKVLAAHARTGSRDGGYTRFWLGYALRLRGDAGAAKVEHERALATLLELEGADSNFALSVRAELAADERDLGAFDAARAGIERARADAARIAPGADDSTTRNLRYLAAQLDLLQGRAAAATAAEFERVFARAKERPPTAMTRWQAAGAGLLSALCRLRLRIGDAAQARTEILVHADVLRASPLADPFFKRLAAQASNEARATP